MRTIDITERQEEHGNLQAFMMTLRPRRSADPRVAYGFCAVLGVVWLMAGAMIASFGGWPVLGFFGAEFIFIAGMIYIFLRRTEVVETVEITAETVHVTRRDPRGREDKAFPAYWTQVHFDGSPTENATLEIRSHGERVEIGRFLSASEKDRTALKIADVLQRLRTAAPR